MLHFFKTKTRKIANMLCVFLSIAFASHLVLDQESVRLSLRKFHATIPLDTPDCSVQSGVRRTLVTFDAKLRNEGTDAIVNEPPFAIPWRVNCSSIARQGNITVNCMNDHCDIPEENVFFSCASSGLSEGCWTRVRPGICDSIDISGSNNDDPTCMLILGDVEYDLNQVPFERDMFWSYFILDSSVFVGATLLAATRAFIDPPSFP
jgi:hypothetical protein